MKGKSGSTTIKRGPDGEIQSMRFRGNDANEFFKAITGGLPSEEEPAPHIRSSEEVRDAIINGLRALTKLGAELHQGSDALRDRLDLLAETIIQVRDDHPIKDMNWSALLMHIENCRKKLNVMELGSFTIQIKHITEQAYQKLP